MKKKKKQQQNVVIHWRCCDICGRAQMCIAVPCHAIRQPKISIETVPYCVCLCDDCLVEDNSLEGK